MRFDLKHLYHFIYNSLHLVYLNPFISSVYNLFFSGQMKCPD